MGIPITRTVTLAWDGVAWRDQETGVLVTGVALLHSFSDAVPEQAPLQQHTHGFDKSGSISYEVAQKLIAQTFENRTISPLVYYFAPPDDALITYAYLRQTVQAQSIEINQLERRIAQLERPWWQRWRSR